MPIIAYEGPDGIGKSTIIKLTADFLRSHGEKVTVAPNPGATALGRLIRKIVKRPEEFDPTMKIGPVTEQLLMLCDNNSFIEETMRPASESKDWLLMDRSNFISGIIYGTSRGAHIHDLVQMFEAIPNPPKIDWLFIFNCSKDTLLARKANRDNPEKCSFEQRPSAFHEKVWRSYATLLADYSHYLDRYVRKEGGHLNAFYVNAADGPQDVFDLIRKALPGGFSPLGMY